MSEIFKIRLGWTLDKFDIRNIISTLFLEDDFVVLFSEQQVCVSLLLIIQATEVDFADAVTRPRSVHPNFPI